jgi:hypothetical protein
MAGSGGLWICFCWWWENHLGSSSRLKKMAVTESQRDGDEPRLRIKLIDMVVNK